MAQNDDSSHPQTEPLTPWVIGVLGLILIALAMYMNYGSSLHWGSSTDVSATSQAGSDSTK